ncbi:hypothetical protein LJB83_01590 [Clostridia bacterium OttesenSCG-928-F22]|nr:hypothetical protein [Clostridia bacterium OttesenSCG-928-F22]
MKKIFYVIILLTVIVGVLLLVIFHIKPAKEIYVENVREFKLSEYKKEITMFPMCLNVGEVASEEDAIEKARELWRKTWPDRLDELEEEDAREKEVSFDYESQCWLVQGTLPEDWMGGVSNALIKVDGTVLAVWGTQ